MIYIYKVSRFSRKIEQLANPILGDVEHIIVAIRAKPPWNISAAMAGGISASTTGTTGVGFNTGSSDQSKRAKEEKSALKSNFPYPASMAIVLTNKRVLMWERSILWGYIKTFTGDFEIDKIKSVRLFNERGFGDRILFHLKDENSVRVYGKRKDGTKKFVEELKKRVV